MTDDIKKKLGFGRLECPHCSTVRQGRDAMDEHIDAKHGDIRRIGDSQEVIPGADFAPDAIAEYMDTITGAAEEAGWTEDPETENKVRTFAASLPQWKGKRMPEFIIMWRPDCVPVSVHSTQRVELSLRKGFKLRPPTQDEYDQSWFHWRCPVPICPDSTADCQMHDKKGSDSNHPLRSPEYMVIQHLQSGGKLHKQYFEMHKTELQKEYRAAFAAFELQMKESAAASERQRQESERRTEEDLVVAGSKE